MLAGLPLSSLTQDILSGEASPFFLLVYVCDCETWCLFIERISVRVRSALKSEFNIIFFFFHHPELGQ